MKQGIVMMLVGLLLGYFSYHLALEENMPQAIIPVVMSLLLILVGAGFVRHQRTFKILMRVLLKTMCVFLGIIVIYAVIVAAQYASAGTTNLPLTFLSGAVFLIGGLYLLRQEL